MEKQSQKDCSLSVDMLQYVACSAPQNKHVSFWLLATLCV